MRWLAILILASAFGPRLFVAHVAPAPVPLLAAVQSGASGEERASIPAIGAPASRRGRIAQRSSFAAVVVAVACVATGVKAGKVVAAVNLRSEVNIELNFSPKL